MTETFTLEYQKKKKIKLACFSLITCMGKGGKKTDLTWVIKNTGKCLNITFFPKQNILSNITYLCI